MHKPSPVDSPAYSYRYRPFEIDGDGLYECAACRSEWLWEDKDACGECGAVTFRYSQGEDHHMAVLVPSAQDIEYMSMMSHKFHYSDIEDAEHARAFYLQNKGVKP